MRQTDYVILGLLSEQDLTGYQIKKLVDMRFRFFWSESFGQIFPRLKSLCERGLAEEIEDDAKIHCINDTEDEVTSLEKGQGKSSGKRTTRVYRITEAGREDLRKWLAMPVEKESLRLEILLKMYFSDHVSEDAMLCHLEEFQRSHQKDLAVLLEFQKELTKIEHEHSDHPNILRVIDFGVKVNEAYLAWSRETELFLKERKKS